MRAFRLEFPLCCCGRSNKASNAGHVFGSPPQAAFLSSSSDERSRERHRCIAPDQRTDSFWTPDLVPRKSQKIRPEIIDIAWNSSGRLNGIDVQNSACRVHQRGHLRYRLNSAGLVVGQHDRDQHRARGIAQAALQRGKFNDAVSTDWKSFNIARRKAPPGKHRGMLGGRNKKLEVTPRPVLNQRRERKHVGFSATGREGHVARFGADEHRDMLARLLNKPARRPALAMNGGWVARRIEGSKHCRARLGTQRRTGIPVEIKAFVHDLGSGFAARAGVSNPFETLAFRPSTRAKTSPPEPKRFHYGSAKSVVFLARYMQPPSPSNGLPE